MVGSVCVPRWRPWTLGALVAAGLSIPVNAAPPVDAARLKAAALSGDWKQVQAMGPAVMPSLVELYTASSEKDRATIAEVFYNLGWKSPAAKRALMADVHTQDRRLRLQAQWALGRVSDDPEVVDVLLDNMRNDPEPLFRDKAACALAYDQIHLAPAQRLRLLTGLIAGLEDEKPQVRQIALQALQILTGQTKGFVPGGDPTARARAVAEWKRWLDEYRANL
jgi:HEAT repeats